MEKTNQVLNLFETTGLTNKQIRWLAKSLKLDNSGEINEVFKRVENYLKSLPKEVQEFLKKAESDLQNGKANLAITNKKELS